MHNIPVGDSKPALPCTLAKWSTCHKETIPCSDSACQKAKMRDVLAPSILFPQNGFVLSFQLGVSVSGPFSRPRLSNESCLLEIFICTTSPIFHRYVKRETVSGTDVMLKESKSYIAQSHQARDDWRTVWGQGPVARTLIVFVSMFSCYSVVQSVIYFFSGMMQLSGLQWPLELVAWHFCHLFPVPFLLSTTSQKCLQDPFPSYGSNYIPAWSFAGAFPLLLYAKTVKIESKEVHTMGHLKGNGQSQGDSNCCKRGESWECKSHKDWHYSRDASREMRKQGNSNCNTGLRWEAEHTGLLPWCCWAGLGLAELGQALKQRSRGARVFLTRGSVRLGSKRAEEGELGKIRESQPVQWGGALWTVINKLGKTAPSTVQSMRYWKMGKHGQGYNHRIQLNCPLSVFFLFSLHRKVISKFWNQHLFGEKKIPLA